MKTITNYYEKYYKNIVFGLLEFVLGRSLKIIIFKYLQVDLFAFYIVFNVFSNIFINNVNMKVCLIETFLIKLVARIKESMLLFYNSTFNGRNGLEI